MSINIASEIVHFAGRFAHPPAPAPSRSTRRGLSGIECRPVQRVQCSGVSWHGLPWYLPRPGSGTVCAAACRVYSVRVCAGGWGLHRRGMWGAPGVGQVMPAIKFFKEKGVPSPHPPPFTNQNPSDCASLQKFQK